MVRHRGRKFGRTAKDLHDPRPLIYALEGRLNTLSFRVSNGAKLRAADRKIILWGDDADVAQSKVSLDKAREW